MSSFASSASPLDPTEGIDEGVVSDVSERQTQTPSSRTTSIHILDDDSLLNIFYLYRPAVVLTEEDEIFDAVYMSIIKARIWERNHWWYKPAQVCRRWRNLILGSASFLGLCLVCTHDTPVAEMLAHSPPLPLVINYSHEDSNLNAEDKEGGFLALEQPNRIRSIRVGLSLKDLQNFFMKVNCEFPILEELVMVVATESEEAMTIPDTIQVPHLRHLVLVSIAPPIVSRLLTTALGLVTLFISADSFTRFNPSSLLQWISSLPQLETLVIDALPIFDEETQLSHTPTVTHATLPNLRVLSFQGVSNYLEVLIRQIATPHLERLHIAFFDELPFSIPCLVRFMNTTEHQRLRFDIAKLEFSAGRTRVETYPYEGSSWCSFSMSVGCSDINERIFSMAQVVDALGQVFSTADHLVLGYRKYSQSSEYEFDFEDDRRTNWHKILRPFSNVKSLRVHHGMVDDFSCFLRLNDGELPLDLLSKLQELTYSTSTNGGDAFTSFTDARRNVGYPVSLVRRSPSPSSSDSDFVTSASSEDEWDF